MREWSKRLNRQLALLLAYSPPVAIPSAVAALGAIVKQQHEHDANGTNGHAADGDSDDSDNSVVSDDSSDYDPGVINPMAAQPAGTPGGSGGGAGAVEVEGGAVVGRSMSFGRAQSGGPGATPSYIVSPGAATC